MKKLVIIVLIIAAGYYWVWPKVSNQLASSTTEPLYEEPYIVVYGRDTCGWTKKYLKDLDNQGLEYVYESVDKTGVGDELHPRMRQAGLDTSRYLLPVIEVNNTMVIRPKMGEIISSYNTLSEH